jgi:hypothetical protein
MSVDVQKIYQQTVLPLSQLEQLRLAALILNGISGPARKDKPKRKGDIRKFFGIWKGGDAKGSENEQIDRDLARAYALEDKREGS